MGEQDWDKATRLLAGLRPSLHRIEERLAERLTRILMAPYIHGAVGVEPSWRPTTARSLHRLRTTARDRPELEPLPRHRRQSNRPRHETARDGWAAFIAELDTIPAFSPADRPLLKAMVWNAVSMLYCLELQDFESEPSLMAMFSPYYLVPDEKAEAVRLKKQSIDSLEKSLALAPDHLPTYRLLFETHERFGNEAASEAAARRYSSGSPTISKRSSSWPIAARLKTSSISRSPIFRRRTSRSLWTTRCESGSPQSASDSLAAAHSRNAGKTAARSFSPPRNSPPIFARSIIAWREKVLFEAKAGQRDASDQFQKEAMASLEDPTPLWLVLTIESIRYRFSATMTTGYAELWTAGLKKKCQSRTAGEMAKTLDAYLKSEVEYPGRQGHVEKLVGS